MVAVEWSDLTLAGAIVTVLFVGITFGAVLTLRLGKIIVGYLTARHDNEGTDGPPRP